MGPQRQSSVGPQRQSSVGPQRQSSLAGGQLRQASPSSRGLEVASALRVQSPSGRTATMQGSVSGPLTSPLRSQPQVGQPGAATAWAEWAARWRASQKSLEVPTGQDPSLASGMRLGNADAFAMRRPFGTPEI